MSPVKVIPTTNDGLVRMKNFIIAPIIVMTCLRLKSSHKQDVAFTCCNKKLASNEL